MSTAEAGQVIQHHDPSLDADDTYEAESITETESFYSDTTSLNSSVFNYEYENGRRYHAYKAGKYYIPNDEEEQDRLDLAHHVWLLTLRGDLYRAPLAEKPPQRALDIGAGTGIWTIEFGDMFPDCHVTGTDLSPIQPRWTPPNVYFEVDDCEDDWTFREKFDYIHTRNMVGTVKDWPDLIKKAYDNLNPGGLLELQESETWPYSDDGSVTDSSACITFTKKMYEATAILGRHQAITASDLASYLLAAGFTDVTVQNVKMPAGKWPKEKRFKEIGLANRELLKASTEAFGLGLFCRVLGMSEKDARKLMDDYSDEVFQGKVHLYYKSHVVFGRKPEDAK